MVRIERAFRVLALCAAVVLFLFAAPIALASPTPPSAPVTFTVLSTNDLHGTLEGSGSNPGMARVAQFIKTESVSPNPVIVADAGDALAGTLLSNLTRGKVMVGAMNAVPYSISTFGNRDFDWSVAELSSRVTEAAYPFVSANIVVNDTGNCETAGWTQPPFVDAPYHVISLGTAPNEIKVAFIGVTTQETPWINRQIQGLCFKDPTASILRHHDAMLAAGANVIVVLSHLGSTDGGYGYGFAVYGEQTLARQLKEAGKPVDLIIGGHSHTQMSAAIDVDGTLVTQAHYNGRRVGKAVVTVQPSGDVGIVWSPLAVPTAGAADPVVAAMVTTAAADPAYIAAVNEEIAWTNVPIAKAAEGDSLMAQFIGKAVYSELNTDVDPANDVDAVLMNAGGLRANISKATYPAAITYGDLFSVLPFGNRALTTNITGAQLLEALNQSASKEGILQTYGLRYKYFAYVEDLPGPTDPVWASGAFEPTIYDRVTQSWVPLDLSRTYRVATNDFLAPAGGDGISAMKYVTATLYEDDMLEVVVRGARDLWPEATPFNEALAGALTRDGDGDDVYEPGEIVPITILHHNDSHGNLVKGQYVGYTQLATLIKQQRAYNPTRTLLLHAGDGIQGDGLMYLFRSSWSGVDADGTALAAPLTTHPFIAAMNAMDYDGFVLGNHEFDFGSTVFKGILNQADFPVLGANVADSGAYGLAEVGPAGERGVQPHTSRTLDGVKVAILGLTNHAVPSAQLPSNIPGLTFMNPLTKAQELVPALRATHDVVVALTHIGFAPNPASVEVDSNVDVALAATTSGLDAIIGGHSHTDPSKAFSEYKYLPTLVASPENKGVLVSQAYRYNTYLGVITIGVRPEPGGFEVVSRSGSYFSVANSTVEDASTAALLAPYTAHKAVSDAAVLGSTAVPLTSIAAYTEETNVANLEVDSSLAGLRSEAIPVDFFLSGAEVNRLLASGATAASPVSLNRADLYSLMPYENHAVVLRMNGPQIKRVLERAYRNYYYFKYVPGYGGYSHYTTAMLTVSSGGQVRYFDTYPALPDGNNVISLTIDGVPVDFTDAGRYYRVGTVNWLAAGSGNFNDSGVSLWPLEQLEAEPLLFVRDAVTAFVKGEKDKGKPIAPAIEGRLAFVLPTDTFSVSGSVGPGGGGATISFGGGSTTADPATGDFSFPVNASWAGTVTPAKDGYTFDPPSRSVGPVFSAVSAVAFAAIPMHTVSGEVTGAMGAQVTITYDGGSTTTDPLGRYSFIVADGWTGTITASARGLVFTPPLITISAPVSADLPDQDFTVAPAIPTLSVFAIAMLAMSLLAAGWVMSRRA